jgi:nucleotide-binding universal stress UspA family protein
MRTRRGEAMSATPVEPAYAVVAVDGSEEGFTAVSFAAREALRHELELRIVHVMPLYVPVRPLVMGTEHGLGAFASETLASATRVADDVAPGLAITTHAPMGGRVSEVVGMAERARFIAVGRRSSSALDRAWPGGTLDGIVSRARCPVFVVPTAKTHDDRPYRVVAGFKSADHSAELFATAFRDAEELGAEVQVVHAWKLPVGYDDMIARRVAEATWNREQKAAIRDVLEPWTEAYPHSRVRIQVVHESPVRALVEASREADRLVLVKPLHGSSIHHLGRTARGALRFAECPVHVVPAKPGEKLTMPAISVEREGELVR